MDVAAALDLTSLGPVRESRKGRHSTEKLRSPRLCALGWSGTNLVATGNVAQHGGRS